MDKHLHNLLFDLLPFSLDLVSFDAGGFSVVLEVRCTSGNNEKLALKRVAVNNDQDLYLCRQEIAIMVSMFSTYMYSRRSIYIYMYVYILYI